jgi:hypothetical protein
VLRFGKERDGEFVAPIIVAAVGVKTRFHC